jgi:L-amino acid N-acyltransferase YncA
MEIQNMLTKHWITVKNIYEEGIATGNATFQIVAPSWEEWDKSHTEHSRIVAIIDDVIVVGQL